MINKIEPKKQTKVALYIRVSTEEQGEKYGIPMQQEAILSYLKSRGKLDDKRDSMVLAGEEYIYIDKGISGLTQMDERPAFSSLMEDVKNSLAKPFDTVAVFKVDRFARKLKILLNIIDFFEENNIKFISVNESIDTSTPFGRAILGIMGVIAELEIETTKIRTTSGKRKAKELGVFIGSIPYGYKSKDKKLEPFHKEVEIIKRIFNKFVFDNQNTRQIADDLGLEKILSPMASAIYDKKMKIKNKKVNNDYFWRTDTVKKILENEIYIGKYYFSKTKLGKRIPKEKWKLSDYRYPIIIEPRIFEEAQKKLKESADKVSLNRKRKGDHIYFLSGLLKCGYCSRDGESEKHGWVGNRKQIGKNTHKYSYYYICGHKNTRKYSNTCPTIPILAEPIDNFVLDFIKKLLRDPKTIFEYQNKLKSNKKRIAFLEKERNDIQDKLNQVPQRLSNLSIQHENSFIDDMELIKRKEEVELERHNLAVKLIDLNRTLGEQQLSQGYSESFSAYAKKYKNVINNLKTNDSELYEFIHGIISEIVVNTRPFDPTKDRIAGRKKDNQQIPESLTIKIKLPQELMSKLTTQYITSSKFDVKTAEL